MVDLSSALFFFLFLMVKYSMIERLLSVPCRGAFVRKFRFAPMSTVAF
jgi:hypothetical protein